MKDIFLSYSKRDADRVRVLVEALERQGWSVWWDRTIPPGRTWAQVIEEAITGCKCTVVVWSQNSTRSEWVQKEARKGEQRRNLIPVAIDPVPPPFEFEHLQAASLAGWDGVAPHDQWDRLVEQITAVVEAADGDAGADRERIKAERQHRRSALRLRQVAVSALAGASLIVLGAALFVRSGAVEVELEALKLDGLSFELPAAGGSSAPVLVSQEIPVLTLVASGLRQVRVPRSEGSPGRAVAGGPLLLATQPDAGTIGLAGLELPPGARVEIRKPKESPDYLMRIDGADGSLGIAVSGRVLTGAGDLSETLDYGVGGRIDALPDTRDLQLEFEPGGASISLVENVPVADLELHRIDQDVDLGSTRISHVSTIHAGALSADWMGRRELNPRAPLHFDTFDGEIRDLRLEGDTIVLTAHGRSVTGMQSGFGPERADWMPTLFGALSGPAKVVAVALAVLYLAGLSYLLLRVWRRTL